MQKKAAAAMIAPSAAAAVSVPAGEMPTQDQIRRARERRERLRQHPEDAEGKEFFCFGMFYSVYV